LGWVHHHFELPFVVGSEDSWLASQEDWEFSELSWTSMAAYVFSRVARRVANRRSQSSTWSPRRVTVDSWPLMRAVIWPSYLSERPAAAVLMRDAISCRVASTWAGLAARAAWNFSAS